MSLTEKKFGLQHNFPKIIPGMEKIEDEGEKSEEWQNKEETRRVVYTVMGGGKEWGGVWLKDIRLLSTDKVIGGELMRVQYAKDTETKNQVVTVFVDVLKVDLRDWHLETFLWSSDNGGKIEEMGCSKYPNFERKFTMEDCIQAVTDESVHFLMDLPEQIDVEETARLFLEQLEERNFALPTLIEL
jgi:hypothetical protein